MNFTALYQSYYPMVYRQIWSRIRQREQAEDLAHDTFIKALRAWDRAPDDPEALRRWLGAIARNTTIDALRRSRLIMWSELGEDNQFATSDLQETIATRLEVQAVLSELPVSAATSRAASKKASAETKGPRTWRRVGLRAQDRRSHQAFCRPDFSGGWAQKSGGVLCNQAGSDDGKE